MKYDDIDPITGKPMTPAQIRHDAEFLILALVVVWLLVLAAIARGMGWL